MSTIQKLLTDHIDIWTAADAEKKSGRGRASSNGNSLYGIRKLRELILELAMRGKLVQQNACDEPASELINRIQIEKSKLLTDGRIKKNGPLTSISKDEEPFELAKGWKWAKLNDISLKITDGEHISPKKTSQGMPLLSAKDVTDNGLVFDSPQYVSVEDGIRFRSRCDPQRGDILICSRGTIGRSAAVEIDDLFCLMGSVILIKNSNHLSYSYVVRYLQSNIARNWMYGASSATAVSALYLKDVAKCLIPLPPVEEQHRIVAKVNELMALCDQLESQQSDVADAHEQLVSHLLGTLTQSQNAADFNANWQRIAAHFDTLFTTEASIDAFKQTLLQLAVMGKLVAQDANDEPARELLNRIETKKAKLVSEGKIKKEKLLATIGMNEKPFYLPENWEWIRLGTFVEKSGAGWSPSCEGHARVGDSWGVLKVSAVSWGEFLPDENKALPKTLEPRLDCVVESGDFLITRANTDELVARSVVVENCPPNLMLSDKIVRLRLSLLCSNKFINLVNLSPFSRNYYALAAGGTSSSMKNVTREQILNLVVATPPLAEQHRIVAKVDELMALCDQLKLRILTANQQKKKLADILVEHAVVG